VDRHPVQFRGGPLDGRWLTVDVESGTGRLPLTVLYAASKPITFTADPDPLALVPETFAYQLNFLGEPGPPGPAGLPWRPMSWRPMYVLRGLTPGTFPG
jgi:hypothetical protein